jgi:hypothetical protein
MHFDATISIGNIVAFFTIIGAIWRIERLMNWFLIEHEILIKDYCSRQNPPIEIGDLPTRSKRGRG